MSRRPPLSWLGAVAGLGAQLVVLVVLTVDLVHEARVDGDDATNPADAVFRDLFGPVVFATMAVAAGLLALLVVAALLLSLPRGGSRIAGLVVGVVLQVPFVGYSVVLLDDSVEPPVVVTLVGGALVVLAAVVPATWRWCRRPRLAAGTTPAVPA